MYKPIYFYQNYFSDFQFFNIQSEEKPGVNYCKKKNLLNDFFCGLQRYDLFAFPSKIITDFIHNKL